MREKQPNLRTRHYRFELLAEFNQFYLQDGFTESEIDWTDQEVEDKVSLAPGIIAVDTNCDRVVLVEVHIFSSEPACNTETWDHVVECSIDVLSGRLVVVGCCEDFKTASRIRLEAGRYRARVCYGNQYAADNHVDCSDYYIAMLWRSSDKSTLIVKRRVDEFYELIG